MHHIDKSSPPDVGAPEVLLESRVFRTWDKSSSKELLVRSQCQLAAPDRTKLNYRGGVGTCPSATRRIPAVQAAISISRKRSARSGLGNVEKGWFADRRL